MDNLKDGHQWLFLIENIWSGIPEIEFQWATLKAGIIQELNLMGHVPVGFHSNPRQELQDYIDNLSD
jgi:hypothetical protein